MGQASIPLSYLKHVLEREPERISWSEPREVILRRGAGGKLGIRLQTYQGENENFCIISLVKEECQLLRGILNSYERIVKINTVQINGLSDEEIRQCLALIPGQIISLTVCCLVKIHEPKHSCASIDPKYDSWPLVNSNSIKSQFEPRQDSCCNWLESGHHVLVSKTNSFSDTVPLRFIEPGECPNQKTVTQGNRKSGDSGINFSDDDACSPLNRGYSKVSNSDSVGSDNSNQSYCSNSPPWRQEMMSRRTKGDKHGKETFYKTRGQDRELEPLKARESKSPIIHGKSDLRFTFPEERSLSLPLCSDAAVSMRDIDIDEDLTHSLPVGHVSQCHCASCAGTSDRSYCNSCGNGSLQQGASLKGSGSEVKLLPEGPEEMREEYGEYLLKHPHLAVWDVNTRVVKLDKGGHKEFGFGYKVKVGKNQDESVEVYTLVKHVEKGGPATGKLKVGDWIRSIDGTPIMDPKQIATLIGNSSNNNTMRVVIQRPVGFSQHPKKMGPYSVTKPTTPVTPRPALPHRDPHILLPGTTESPKKPQEKIHPQMTVIPGIDPSFKVPFPKIVKFPKVRVFVCGSEAERCVAYILRDSDIEIGHRQHGYAYVEFSIATDRFGKVLISQVCSNLYTASNNLSRPNPSELSEDCDSRCKSCGSELGADGSQTKLGSVINVELHAVTDDRLFHNCCSYLFSKSSVFLLTFDCTKLLQSTVNEFSRMQNLSHTIRSFSDECHVTMCGLLGSGTESTNIMDEIRVLFYGPYNTQRQLYNVTGPELFNVNSVSSGRCNHTDRHELQTLLWKSLSDSIHRQRSPQPALLILDYLQSVHDSKESVVTEENFMSLIRSKLPEYELDVHYTILTDLGLFGEIIRGKATVYNFLEASSIEHLVQLDPKLLLQHLCKVVSVVTEDKPYLSRIQAKGFISSEELYSIFMLPDKEACKVLTEFLECTGLIFRKPKPSNVGSLEYFVPSFAAVPSAECPSSTRKDSELYIQFCNGHESCQVFYQLVFGVAGQCDSPGSLTIVANNCFTLTHAARLMTFVHQKLDDMVKVIFKKEDKSVSKSGSDFNDWLYKSAKRALNDVKFKLGVMCPMGDNCNHRATGSHIIDLHELPGKGDPRVRKWLPEPTSPAEPVLSSTDLSLSTNRTEQQQNSTSQDALRLNVNKITYALQRTICLRLRLHSTLMRDWKGLAGVMGLTSDDVELYDTVQDKDGGPAKQLLLEWGRSDRGATLGRLVTYLHQLDRQDIISEIQETYNIPDADIEACREKDGAGAGGQGQTRHRNTPPHSAASGRREKTSNTNVNINNTPAVLYERGSSPMMLQVESPESYASSRSPLLSPTSGSSSPRGGACYANEAMENVSITVAERGAGSVSLTDEGAGYSANVGVTLNCVEGSGSSDHLATRNRVITPVE